MILHANINLTWLGMHIASQCVHGLRNLLCYPVVLTLIVKWSFHLDFFTSFLAYYYDDTRVSVWCGRLWVHIPQWLTISTTQVVTCQKHSWAKDYDQDLFTENAISNQHSKLTFWCLDSQMVLLRNSPNAFRHH